MACQLIFVISSSCVHYSDYFWLFSVQYRTYSLTYAGNLRLSHDISIISDHQFMTFQTHSKSQNS